MKQTMFKAMLIALPLTLAVPASASPPEGDEAVEPGAEPTEEEALEDDILLVIDLPIAADEARAVGVEEADLDEALDAAEEAAVPASDMTEVIAEETEQVKAKGKRKAFGQWVKLQIAEGVRGKDLAAKIKERKDELAEMTDEQKAELDAKLEELGKQHREHRKKLHEKRKQLRDEGKAVVLAGKERHDKFMAEAAKRHAADKAKWKQAHKGKPGDKIDERQDKIDDKQEAIDEKQEDAAGDPEKQDKLEKREEKLEKREEKLEKREEKLEEKHEGKHDQHGGKPGKPDKKGPG